MTPNEQLPLTLLQNPTDNILRVPTPKGTRILGIYLTDTAYGEHEWISVHDETVRPDDEEGALRRGGEYEGISDVTGANRTVYVDHKWDIWTWNREAFAWEEPTECEYANGLYRKAIGLRSCVFEETVLADEEAFRKAALQLLKTYPGLMDSPNFQTMCRSVLHDAETIQSLTTAKQ